jgi:hypothetical protein
MEAKEPARPAWPRIRVTSAGLGFAGAAPAARASECARRAQVTLVVDGVQLTAGTIQSA